MTLLGEDQFFQNWEGDKDICNICVWDAFPFMCHTK